MGGTLPADANPGSRSLYLGKAECIWAGTMLGKGLPKVKGTPGFCSLFFMRAVSHMLRQGKLDFVDAFLALTGLQTVVSMIFLLRSEAVKSFPNTLNFYYTADSIPSLSFFGDGSSKSRICHPASPQSPVTWGPQGGSDAVAAVLHQGCTGRVCCVGSPAVIHCDLQLQIAEYQVHVEC